MATRVLCTTILFQILYLIINVAHSISNVNVTRSTLPSYEQFLNDTKKQSKQCPCSDINLCNNIKTQHQKELYGFVSGTHGGNISIYNWTYITTLAWAPISSPELMCTAHMHNARVTASIDSSTIPLTFNATERQIWINQTFEQITYYYYDGLVFDYENPMLSNDIKSQQYNIIVNETTQYFHNNLPGTQITVCLPYESFIYDGREYDALNLSLSADLLYIMDYDTQDQIYSSQCIAAANAPYFGMMYGIQSYLNLGIPSNKLILGIPWYGYNYTCNMEEMESKTSKYCPLKFDTFRSVNCSGQVGNERLYVNLMQIIDDGYNITSIRWDASMLAPFYNYMLNGNKEQVFQVWYDDVQSLSVKYEYAKTMSLRGIGPFCFPFLYDTFSDIEMTRAQQMWSAFDNFFV
eukprot:158772_1